MQGILSSKSIQFSVAVDRIDWTDGGKRKKQSGSDILFCTGVLRMAGKVDSATHAAAVAKIGEAIRHEAELRSHLHEIINGAAFKGSHRCQAFLKHVFDLALHGDPADLRERSIGVALFGRSATYDTADDAIVRVTASDVRKRLLQHYGNTGAHSKFRINLPSGSYVPEFCFIPASALTSLDPPAVASPPTDNDVVLQAVAPDEPAPRARRWRVPAVALLLICIAAAGWGVMKRWTLSDPSESLIVAAFQGTAHAAQVVVADDALVLIQVLLDRRFTLDEYENLTYLNVPELAQKKDLLRFWGSLSTRQITNVGDLQNANRIAGDLQARGWDVTIRQARQMHARSFRSGNFVVLGSSLSNPWAAFSRRTNRTFHSTSCRGRANPRSYSIAGLSRVSPRSSKSSWIPRPARRLHSPECICWKTPPTRDACCWWPDNRCRRPRWPGSYCSAKTRRRRYGACWAFRPASGFRTWKWCCAYRSRMRSATAWNWWHAAKSPIAPSNLRLTTIDQGGEMQRREFLKGLLAAPVMPAAAYADYQDRTKGLPPLTIKDVKVITTSGGRNYRWVFLKIITSEPGLYGIGSANDNYQTRPWSPRWKSTSSRG